VVISTTGLTRRFGKLVAVDHLALEVPKARIQGFLGPNGSGMTTAIRMLCGLLEPSEGRATVLGWQVPGRTESLRQHIGYMTQRFSLYQDLTVNENLRFVGHVYTLSSQRLRQRFDYVRERYDLTSIGDQLAGNLSGGQRQRLALAAATPHQPDLLLFDEPTSAVDPETRRHFWDSLYKLAAEGASILVSTHFMDEAERCHFLAILDEGRKVADGEPEELKAEIGYAVVEIEVGDPVKGRSILAELDAVATVAQLGTRLRALVDPAEPQPVELIRRRLQEENLGEEAHQVEPNLEDVFMAVTR
jgi:ABC-2 type transport system ATP-binding protein